ncbi:MAG: 30S ribosomal protein S17 [Candidatus Marinimicrobia bacterium]|jgi:small subunit ribosomal protein S17|nr:30S ribosomal protein S17 [Candidatus Neomarinimicrobiota bacterium]MBI66459.1 30S ribosomal protein S17 [Candidatus Neomarinimicrobiota bacterium]|tara:strand:- start:419 stop:667 length:249 start_codon:yes stop_codon:yes gene_type:complete
MAEIRKRQKLVGEVISEKMQKTVVVNVTKKIAHPVYGKYVKRSKKYMAHVGAVEANIGNIVEIRLIPPMSKNKRWLVSKVIR